MQAINIEMIRNRAAEVRQNTAKIQRYAAQPDAEFWADERNIHTVMHLLLLSIESVAAICNHLMAKVGHRASASYSECFEGLGEMEVLDDPIVHRLIQMARFRNILVHRYWDVDEKRVLDYARNNLDDFEAFLTAIGRFAGQHL
ncbi:MAG: DUF86 domain-containing protein [Anaerolineae bacterium]